jgi:hypothetical protein
MVLKCGNDFEISAFCRSQTFAKVENKEIILRISKICENDSCRGSCPSSSPRGNLVAAVAGV